MGKVNWCPEHMSEPSQPVIYTVWNAIVQISSLTHISSANFAFNLIVRQKSWPLVCDQNDRTSIIACILVATSKTYKIPYGVIWYRNKKSRSPSLLDRLIFLSSTNVGKLDFFRWSTSSSQDSNSNDDSSLFQRQNNILRSNCGDKSELFVLFRKVYESHGW